MSTTGQNLINQINAKIRNYAVEAFHNMALNSILLQIIAWIDGQSGGITATSQVLQITSADFTNATDCPLVALNGANLVIFFNEGQKYLIKTTDWIDLVGGGFRVTIPLFDSTADTYHFFIYQAA